MKWKIPEVHLSSKAPRGKKCDLPDVVFSPFSTECKQCSYASYNTLRKRKDGVGWEGKQTEKGIGAQINCISMHIRI